MIKWCLDKSVGQTENGLERGLTLAKLCLITGPKILEIPNLLCMSSRANNTKLDIFVNKPRSRATN